MIEIGVAEIGGAIVFLGAGAGVMWKYFIKSTQDNIARQHLLLDQKERLIEGYNQAEAKKLARCEEMHAKSQDKTIELLEQVAEMKGALEATTSLSKKVLQVVEEAAKSGPSGVSTK